MTDKKDEALFELYKEYNARRELAKQEPMVNNPNRYYVEVDMTFHYTENEYYKENLEDVKL